ncbi:MAG: GIN domain-containing protein [Muribaculaceae bacterium]
MKRLLSLATILLLSATMLAGCSAAKNDKSAAAYATLTREYGYIKNFSALKATQGVNVIYTVSTGAVKVSMKASPDVIDRFEARLDSDGTLVLGAKRKKSTKGDKGCSSSATFYISGPAVSELTATSAADINVRGKYALKGDLELKISSAADVAFSSISANKVEIDASSASCFRVEQGCTCRDIEIDASSAASVTVKGIKAKSLEVDAASSAGVTVSGTADDVEYDAVSTAKINADGLKATRGAATAASCANIICDVAKLKQQQASYGTVTNKR